MGLRKEQVLALVALALGAWVGLGYLEEPSYTPRFAPKKVGYEAKPVVATPLASDTKVELSRPGLCTEPSETKPLEPRLLDFPPRSPLSVAALPLDPGPDFGHLYALAMDGGPVPGVTIAQSGTPAEGATASAAPDTGAPAGQSRAEREAQAARSYDRIWHSGLPGPFFGIIEQEDGVDLFALEETPQFEGVTLKMRDYNVDTGKLGSLLTFGHDRQRIDKIALASTLRNEITRRVRKVPPLAPYQAQRRELIGWLLAQAREVSSVYADAMKQAEIHHQLGPADLEGLRMIRAVLRAQGDLAGELKMLQALPTSGLEGSFRFEGVGQVKAQLGLSVEAEADLRTATELAPSDARPFASLAEFLRQRGRAREALPFANRAQQAAGSVMDKTELVRIGRVVASCRLAVGDIDGARAASAIVPKELSQPYVDACVAYAAGDLAAAMAGFRAAGSGPDSAAGSLGQAACLLRQGQLQEAYDQLLRLYDQEPLLRHRSAGALALAFLRANQLEPALLWTDRALEADPLDPYAHYLRGRVLRLLGQSGPAADALTEALRLRDDFVHAIAEMAAVQSARLTAAIEARRYADRAVDLVTKPAVELYELQGLHAFDAFDRKAAGEAFAKARDLAADDKEKWYCKGAIAVVDYSRGLVEEAATSLERMTQDLAKDDPMAKWAQATLEAIADHAQKESLGDSFDRNDVGSIWNGDADGPLGAKIHDGKLVFRDHKLSRNGPGVVQVERVGAVKRGKNFLAASVTMQLGSKHPRVEDFCGLGIEIQKGNGGVEFQVRLGLREGKPLLKIQDGREDGRDAVVQQTLVVDGFDDSKPQQLELRVVPRGDAGNRLFRLRASWNGNEVYSGDLKTLTGNTNPELKTVLFASGKKGNEVDVAFDDFRLERRKDNK